MGGKDRCSALRRFWRVELQPREPPVDVSARPNPLHDFLACVASLGKADVRGFDSSLMGNVMFIEIGAEPGNARLEPEPLQRAITDGRAAPRAHAFGQRLPRTG